jgi:hypothetical protein
MSPLVYEPINGTWAEKGLGDSLVGSTAPKALNPSVNQVHREISGVILSAERLHHECGVGPDAPSSPTLSPHSRQADWLNGALQKRLTKSRWLFSQDAGQMIVGVCFLSTCS